MKKILFVLLMSISYLSFSGKDKYLFYQTSTQGSITKLHKNNYILTLNPLMDHIRYVTVKASKKAGTITLAQFISLWNDKTVKDNFTNNQPHAVISMVSDKGNRQQIIVATVSNPGFAKAAVSYQISVLDDTQVQMGSFRHLVLFFDDILWNPTDLTH